MSTYLSYIIERRFRDDSGNSIWAWDDDGYDLNISLLFIKALNNFYDYTLINTNHYSVELTDSFRTELEKADGSFSLGDGTYTWTAGEPLPDPNPSGSGRIVRSYKGMFEDCTAGSLDLSLFTTKTANDFSDMFKNCTKLTAINLYGFKLNGTEKVSDMFAGTCDEAETTVVGKVDNQETADIFNDYEKTGISSNRLVFGISWNVAFDLGGHGTAIDPLTVANGAKIDIPDEPAAEGYKFGGWYEDEELLTVFDFSQGIYSSMVLHAKWIALCEVSFEMNGHGAAIEKKTVWEGERIADPGAPQAEGFDFGGWYYDAAFTDKFDFADAILADTVLYAKWTAKSSGENGSGENGSGEDGPGEDGPGEGEENEEPEIDVTKDTVTVSFLPGEGSGSMESVKLDKGAEYTLPLCGFTPPEFKLFDKWDKGMPGTKITVTEDISVTALYKEDDAYEKATAPIEIKALPADILLITGKGKTLKAEVPADKGAVKKWSSSDTKVAGVSKKGVIKAVAAGSAAITAEFADGSKKEYKVIVEIPKLPKKKTYDSYEGLVLSRKEKEHTVLIKDAKTVSDPSVISRQFNVTQLLEPGSDVYSAPAKVTSSSAKVMSVDEKSGLVTINKNGKSKITLWYPTQKAGKYHKLSVSVTVKLPDIKAASLSVKAGALKKVTLTNCRNKAVTYTLTSSDTAVCTIDESGKKVRGVAAGSAVICLKADGVVYDSCKVEVK